MPTKSLSIGDHVFQTSKCVVHVLAWVLEIIAEKHQLHQVNLPCHPDKWKSWNLDTSGVAIVRALEEWQAACHLWCLEICSQNQPKQRSLQASQEL